MQNKSTYLKFIVVLGVVSLFADIVYEGGRSISGPLLFTLGASAAVVGLLAGLGEFIGYALRLVSGFFADRFKSYWLFSIVGYALSVLAIPLLALAGNWKVAGGLLILERLGKAWRTPARDVLLSAATEKVGRGKGFALHEALDQIGAIAGPLLLAAFVYFKKEYRSGLVFLFIPAVFTLLALFFARWRYPQELIFCEDNPKKILKAESLSPRFWLYTVFIIFSTLGFAHFQLISYHFKNQAVVSDAYIPLLFALAMAVDGLAALAIGRIYDRVGLLSLLCVPLIVIFIPFFAFSHGYLFAIIGVVLWGTVMGIQETVMRAAVADLTELNQRGLAYGIFNTAYGISWMCGTSLMGWFYAISLKHLINFCIISELISLPIFYWLYKRR